MRLFVFRWWMKFSGIQRSVKILLCGGMVFFLAVAIVAADAQSLSWQSISGVPGCITVKMGGQGKLFAASDGSAHFDGVVYTSTDNGQSWYPTAISYGWIFEVSPYGRHTFVSRLLANGRYQVFLSDDNGLTWRGILGSDPFNSPFSGFMYADSNEIYAVAGFGNSQLVKLHGQRWDPQGTQFPPCSFSTTAIFQNTAVPTPTAMDADKRIYVGTVSNGLSISSNFGSTWAQALPGLKVTAVHADSQQFVVAGTSPNAVRNGGIFLSSDSGSTWTFLGLAEKNITSISTDGVGGIYVSASTGVYRYGGTPNAWDDISPSSEAYGGVEATQSNVYFAASIAKGIFRSTDAGQSWDRSGIPREDIGSLVLTAGGSIVGGSLGNRVFVSSNNGGAWAQTSPGTICDNVYSLLETGSDLLAGTDCGIFRSTDVGRSWSSISGSTIAGGVYALSKDSQGGLSAGTNFGVYRSTDNGLSWKQSGLAGSKIIGLAVSTSDKLFALTGIQGVFVSGDGGGTWSGIGLVRSDLQTIAINSLNHLFIGAGGGVYRSTDEGTTWTNQVFTTAFVYSLAFRDPNTIVAGTGSGVYSTIDEGLTWNSRSVGLNQSVILSVGVDAEGFVYAGALHGGVYKSMSILTSVDDKKFLPKVTELLQNYPNPFNPVTSVEFHLAQAAYTTVEVVNVMGQRIALLVDGLKMPGSYKISWDGGNQPTGIYFYRMRSGTYTESKKMLLIR